MDQRYYSFDKVVPLLQDYITSSSSKFPHGGEAVHPAYLTCKIISSLIGSTIGSKPKGEAHWKNIYPELLSMGVRML